MSPVDLKDYVDVKARIRLFYAAHPDGRLVTAKVKATTAPDGKPRIWVEAHAYRDPDDTLPGKGWSWLELPGATSFTRGSEIENAETSAWGRAIGSLGIGIDASIASRDEIQAKAGESQRPERDPADGLIGNVEVRKPPADMELRQTPEGMAYGFGLVGPGNRGRVQVMAASPLAEALHAAGLTAGERVTVWGSVEMVEWKKGVPPYMRLHLARIETSDFVLPAPVEADSVPMFDAPDDDLSDLPDDLPLPVPVA